MNWLVEQQGKISCYNFFMHMVIKMAEENGLLHVSSSLGPF